MRKTLSLDEALTRIRVAFVPLECVAEGWDHGHRIRLKVFDAAGNARINVDELLRDLFIDASRLELMLGEIAARLKAKGFALDNYPAR